MCKYLTEEQQIHFKNDAQGKLRRCCLTCLYNGGGGLYGCSNDKNCFNGFSAYTPNAEMQKQEAEDAEQKAKQ